MANNRCQQRLQRAARSLLAGAALASLINAAPAADRVAFPQDPSVLDLRRDFGAQGDGVADDTAALQAALEASSDRGRGGGTKILFLPDGTYRLSSNLVVKAAVGPWVYGESRDGVVLRLTDGVATNVTAVLRAHPSDTRETSADFFMRNFRNLTIDVGRNPHADGIRWYGNNSGILKHVRVIGNGRVGINSGWLGQNGPNLIQDALVEGSFETGVRCAWSWGQTLSRVTVRHARREGVYVNATAVGIEDLVVEDTPVALWNEYPNDWKWWGGVVALVGGRFTGGNPAQPAITNTSVLYARNVASRGFKQVLHSATAGGSVTGDRLDEYLSHPAKKLFPDAPDTSLNLPIQPEPRVPWETNLANWVCANDHGAKFGDNRDDTAALQAAIDAAAAAGKTVVYLRGIGGPDPNWYDVKGEVRVHGSVRLIIGLGFGRVIGGEQGRFIVDDRSAPVVKFLHLQAFGGRPPVVENRSATHTLVVESCDLKVLGTGGGDIFVTDCPAAIELRGPGQRLWARQLNPEGDSDTGLVQNHGGRLWALGVKHEGRGVRFLTDRGGQTEILGLFNYAPDIAKDDRRPAFEVIDAAFSAAGAREMSFGNTYPVKVREARGDDVRTEQGGGWIGWSLYRGGMKSSASGTSSPVTAPAADARPPLPRLQVGDNHRFLVTAGGKPFFWLGDTAWELFHRLDRAEAELYLRDRAAKGFNVIQAVALAELDGLTVPNRQGHLPLEDKDPARPAVRPGPDNDYWDFVDAILDEAARRGLYVGFLPTWGSYVTSSAFDGKVNGIFNVTNALAYGQFLGTRYRDRSNLIWILGGDKAPSTPEAVAIWRAMAKGITRGVAGREDDDRVLMTYHTSGPGHVSDYIHDEPWLDFTSAQSSHGDLVASWRFIEMHWNRQPVKPVIDLESSYPDALIPAAWLPEAMRAAHPSTKPANDAHARRAAYWAVFAGAAGHTYGHNSIWQMYAPPRKPILETKLTWREALDAPSAKQMGYLRGLIESRPFLSQKPDQSLIAGDSGAGTNHVRALRGDGYALLYTPVGKPFRVRLDKLTGKQVKAWWFDPRTGTSRVIGQFPREGERDFTPPGEPDVGNDWVLALDDPQRGLGAPRVALDPFDWQGFGGFDTCQWRGFLLCNNRWGGGNGRIWFKDQRDIQLGQIVPVGDLYDEIAQGDEAFNNEMKAHFENAHRLYYQHLRPVLEQENGLAFEEAEQLPMDDPKRRGLKNDDRLIKTLLLAALAPEVESLKNMTPARLAALNHGTVTTFIAGREATTVLNKCRKWAAAVGQIKIQESAGSQPTIQLQLSGVDIQSIIDQAEAVDNHGNRIRKLKEMLFAEFGVESQQELFARKDFRWRGTDRVCDVLLTNVREVMPEGQMPRDVRQITAEPLSPEGVADLLSRSLGEGFASEEDSDDTFRISLAGAQEKMALLFRDGAWHRPTGTTPTTHIIKLPLGVSPQGIDLSTSVENEWLCSEVVRSYGIEVAKCGMETFADYKVLVVERFDRRPASDGTYTSFHSPVKVGRAVSARRGGLGTARPTHASENWYSISGCRKRISARQRQRHPV